jgi:subfamily B ATP-binding cassette protein MsbA
MSNMMVHTDETVSGIRQIHSFRAEGYMMNRFRSLNYKFSRVSKQLYSKKEMATPIGEITGVLAALVLILVGGYLILNGKSALSGSSFIAYLAMYTQIIQPLKNLSQMSSNVQRGIVACEKIFRLIDTPKMIYDSSDTFNKLYFEKSIELKHVGFRYAEKPVLQDVDFTINRGSAVALVGPSGSGKSTIADLLLRFYEVQQGSILIDGIDIRHIRISDLRALTSMVSQDSFLFNDTIFNNIKLGKQDATEEEVHHAAKAANAHSFILNLENGYQTITGERGVKLSGGQRQRIAIARAILKDAPILILDEATSALDTESEQLVQEALNKLMKDRTSLIIAHRLSTIRNADKIIVLQDGRVVEQGSHEELIKVEGVYWKLVFGS